MQSVRSNQAKVVKKSQLAMSADELQHFIWYHLTSADKSVTYKILVIAGKPTKHDQNRMQVKQSKQFF